MMAKELVVFFELVKAGLWPDANVNDNHVSFKDVDWEAVCQMAEDQSVAGLVAEGIDYYRCHVPDFDIPQEWALQFIGRSLQIEQQNKSLNEFIAKLMERLRKENVHALLIKGQGIAQCYERPLWRTSGDVDLLLDAENYQKAKKLLSPIAQKVEQEYRLRLHQGFTIDGVVVELHGSQRGSLSRRINAVNDKVQRECFEKGKVRIWHNDEIDVFLPAVDDDVVFVFTHILQHFFVEGIGLRQICDWCRLLWCYRTELDVGLLESRIKEAGIMSEWKAFGAFAVEYLGMPKDAMPMFGSKVGEFRGKADKICSFIMDVGNFGHNRDTSYYNKYPFIIRKCISMSRRIADLINHARIFPLDALRFFPNIMIHGIREAANGM